MIFGLSTEESDFLFNNKCCRLSTCFKNKPRVGPDSYMFISLQIMIQIRYIILENNSNVIIVVDVYTSFNHKELVICGGVILVEHENCLKKICAMFYNKFDWVNNNPWSEGKSPFKNTSRSKSKLWIE